MKADFHDQSKAKFASAICITKTTINNYIALQKALKDSKRRFIAVKQKRNC